MDVLTRFSRRTIIRSLGASLLVAPVLRAEQALAEGKPIRRLLTMWHPNGSMYLGQASPHGTQTGFSFGNYYQALERHRAETIALTGMRIGGEPWGTQLPAESGHAAGGWGCLTCTSSNSNSHAQGPSIDQFVARKLSEQGLAPSPKAPVFIVGPQGGWKNYYEDAGRPVSVLNSPSNAYANLFANYIPGPGTSAQRAAALISRKRSVLDAAYSQCKGELGVLPAEGKRQLDYHCERIRDLERALQNPVPVASSCTPPQAALTPVALLNPSDANNYPALTDFFFKLIAAAFTCDIVRVASFQFGQTAARFNAPWLNSPVLGQVNTGESNVSDHHSHTHAGNEQTVGLFMRWYAQKYAELLDLLKAPQPDRTRLIDSTVAHWTTEYGKGPAHDTWGAVMFVFTSPKIFTTGRLVSYPVTSFAPTSPEAKIEAQPHHALMVSLIQAMGINGVNQFGAPEGGTGPLAAMTS